MAESNVASSAEQTAMDALHSEIFQALSSLSLPKPDKDAAEIILQASLLGPEPGSNAAEAISTSRLFLGVVAFGRNRRNGTPARRVAAKFVDLIKHDAATNNKLSELEQKFAQRSASEAAETLRRGWFSPGVEQILISSTIVGTLSGLHLIEQILLYEESRWGNLWPSSTLKSLILEEIASGQNAGTAAPAFRRVAEWISALPSRAPRNPAGSAMVIFGLLLPALVAICVKTFALHRQELVSDSIPMFTSGEDRVTALSWGSQPGGALVVGTERGRLFRVSPSNQVEMLQQSSPATGPIVAVRAGSKGPVVRAVRLDNARPQEGGRSFHVDGIVQGLSIGSSPLGLNFEVASAILQSDADFADVPSFIERIAVQVGEGVRLSAAATLPSPSEGQALLVTGFTNGRMDVLGSSLEVIEAVRITEVSQANSAATNHRSVLLIAADRAAFLEETAWVAAVYSDGTLRLLAWRYPGEWHISSFGRPCGALAIPEQLLLSAAAGTILVRCTQGGIRIIRYSPDKPDTATASHYVPLRDLRRSRPPLAESRVTAIQDVQRALAANGFDPGPVDGILGLFSQRQLTEFKESRKLGNASETEVLDELIGATWRTSAAALSPLGDLFAVAGNDGVIRVFVLPKRDDTPPPESAAFLIRGHAGAIPHLAISADGHYLASAGLDGRLWITDLNAARRRARLPFYDLPSGPVQVETNPVPLDNPIPLENPVQLDNPAQAAPSSPPRDNDFVVVFGAHDTLERAQLDLAHAAKAGITTTEILLRDGKYRSVARFPDAQVRARGLAEIRALSTWTRTAYPRSFSSWCPSPEPADGFTKCGSTSGPPMQPARSAISRSAPTESQASGRPSAPAKN